jgi:hypothetical protein
MVVLVLLTAAAVVDRTQPYGISLRHPRGVRHHSPTSHRDRDAATSSVAITRRMLTARTSVSGTLAYDRQGHGTLT